MKSAALRTLLPPLDWWPEVTRRSLRADLVAGVTGAVVVLPQGVAFATLAGMPAVYGLYAAMIPTVVAALWGSSRVLVSGPTTAASLVLLSVLGGLAAPESADYVRLALSLTVLVGLVELVLGLSRLGVLVDFVSHAVVAGFTAGAAVLIVTTQLRHFLGLDIPRGLPPPRALLALWQHLGETHLYAVLVGLATLAAGLLSRRLWPRVPYMLSAMSVGIAVSVLVDRLFYVGAVVPGLPVVGALPAGLPGLSSPDLSFATVKELAPAALAVSLFTLTEAVSIARSLGARRGELIDANQEFVGQGLSNLLGGFFSSYVSTGSFNRSIVNFEAGARSPLAAVFAGVLVLLVIVTLGPLLAYFPNAAMAAVLLMVAVTLVDGPRIAQILRTSRGETVVLGATFVATLLLQLEYAILLGVMVSLVVYLRRAAQPRVLVRMPDPGGGKRNFKTDSRLAECPQLKFVRIDGALFFGAIDYVNSRLRLLARRSPNQKHLLVFARSIEFVDVAGAEMLAREAQRRRRQGGALYLHALKQDASEMLERGGYLDEIGRRNLFATKTRAIKEIFARLDRGICVRCEKRVFLECLDVPRLARPGSESPGPPAVPAGGGRSARDGEGDASR